MRIALFEPDIPQNAGNIFRLGACLGIPIDIIEPAGFIIDDKGAVLSVLSLFKLSINFIIDVRSLDNLSTLFSSNEILANFDMCFTVSLSIDI